MDDTVPVIDLFAGPGGLGEGFESLTDDRNESLFHVALSIEKDPHAHRTLLTRAFFRQFGRSSVPETYYQYLRGEITRDKLFKLHRRQYRRAAKISWLAELGKEDHERVNHRINAALLAKKKAWILIGGPPCQAYSVVGRSALRKIQKDKFEEDERHYLYQEYVQIIADHRPPVFVMENVRGILSSRLNEKLVFNQILEDLENPHKAVASYENGHSHDGRKWNLSYRIVSLVNSTGLFKNSGPVDFLIRAEKFGVPQARHRVILLGIRSDLLMEPDTLHTYPEANVPVKNVIGDLPELRSGISQGEDSNDEWIKILRAVKHQRWFGQGNDSQSQKIWLQMSSVVKVLGEKPLDTGAEFIAAQIGISCHRAWYHDSRLGGVCNHSARSHMKEDLYRYLFAACFAAVTGRSPRLNDFPEALLPKHKNVPQALEEGSLFSDRFRVQVSEKPSTTVISHISKDGHYFIHPDPHQCRSMTVREAARLQTFPDNYFFEGNRTSQYHQVGNVS